MIAAAAESYRPTLFPRRGVTDGEIAADGDQRTWNAVLAQDGERLIGRVALRDSAEIELHSLELERHSLEFWIEHQVAIADQRQCRRCGHLALPPELRERADGHVERALGIVSDLLRRFEHAVEVVTHLHGTPVGRAADAIQLAVGLIIAQLFVELFNACEGGGNGGVIARVNRDARDRTHVWLGGFEARQLLSVFWTRLRRGNTRHN